jgi:hypothetical protein
MATTATTGTTAPIGWRRYLRADDELLVAGFVGGLSKLVVDTVVAPLMLTSPWDVFRMLSSILLGRSVVEPGSPFGAGEAVVGLLVHFCLSFLYAALLLAVLRRRWRGRVAAVAIGCLFGAVLYVVDLHLFTALYPWVSAIRGFLQLASHVIFGAVVALVYVSFHPGPTLEELAPEPEREGARVI